MPDPSQFPPPPPRRPTSNEPVLSLPRRRVRSPLEVSEASAAARESIKAIVSATRAPFYSGSSAAAQTDELERSLHFLEMSLAERERVIAERETQLSDLQRDVAEAEALLFAREKLHAAASDASRRAPVAPAAISPEEKAALEQLRTELERQEAALKEAKQAQREREQFLDESEAKLFEKVQAQQEKEIELEQREEDLRSRERRYREREASTDPQAAAVLKAEDAAVKKFDEMRE